MQIRSFLLMAVLFFGAVATAASAQAADGVATRSGTLRAGPAASYPSVASVSRGESLEIYGCTSGYTWCDVSASGSRGWLPGARLAFLRNGNRLPLASNYATFGLGIVSFGIDDYWGRYYAGRPWYNDNRWRHGNHNRWNRNNQHNTVNNVYNNRTIIQNRNRNETIRQHRVETHRRAVPNPVIVHRQNQHRNQVILNNRGNARTHVTSPANRPALRAAPHTQRAVPPARRGCVQPGKC